MLLYDINTFSCANAAAHSGCRGFPSDTTICPTNRGQYNSCCNFDEAAASLSLEAEKKIYFDLAVKTRDRRKNGGRDNDGHDNDGPHAPVPSNSATNRPVTIRVPTASKTNRPFTILPNQTTSTGFCPFDGKLWTYECDGCEICPDGSTCNLCPVSFAIGT